MGCAFVLLDYPLTRMLSFTVRHLLEIRAAYYVAKLGTVSAAAQHLGVHRATVQRRIDVLEAELGGKVFLRHSRGYSTTDLGRQLLSAAGRIEEEIERFIGYSSIEGTKVDGELIIASTPPSYSPIIVASVKAFREIYSDASVRFLLVDQPPKLELGEAHIYFHFGKKLENPDYVLLPWMTFSGGIYASKSYIQKRGNPKTLDELSQHEFALLTAEHYSPPDDWLRNHVPNSSVAFVSNDRLNIWRAVVDGLAVGNLVDHLAMNNPSIERVALPVPKFASTCWAITHVDSHRSPKVQAYFQCLRDIGLMSKSELEIDPSIMPQV
ncbi:MAG: LysR family transcriptional regulator [Pseudomonadota bacterium]